MASITRLEPVYLQPQPVQGMSMEMAAQVCKESGFVFEGFESVVADLRPGLEISFGSGFSQRDCGTTQAGASWGRDGQ